MRRSSTKFIFIGILFFLVAGVICFKFYTPLKWRIKKIVAKETTTNNCPGCADFFPDVVSVQERAYVSRKMKPAQTLNDLDVLYESEKLLKISDNPKYLTEEMEYARPYVLPEVTVFLDDLSDEYARMLKENNLSYHPFVITNGTRSIQSAKELKNKNQIAREKSHHLYGKTIDISYKQFGDHLLQQECFIKALKKLRSEKRCYVKYEIEGALHTTVR